MATKLTREQHEVRALRALARRARTTSGDARAVGRAREAEAYECVADFLSGYADAVADGFELPVLQRLF